MQNLVSTAALNLANSVLLAAPRDAGLDASGLKAGLPVSPLGWFWGNLAAGGI